MRYDKFSRESQTHVIDHSEELGPRLLLTQGFQHPRAKLYRNYDFAESGRHGTDLDAAHEHNSQKYRLDGQSAA